MVSPPQPKSPAAALPGVDPVRFDGTNINPLTLLATDYLNHFNEAIMLLEMLPMAPDCKDDFLDWRPMSYCEHFAASHFKHRDLAIAAYEVADPGCRGLLDEITDHMNVILTAAGEAMRQELSPHTIGALAAAATRWLKPMVGRAGAVINGELKGESAGDQSIAQDAVDALFDRVVEGASAR
ncbi:MAG TPA: hypothetical protein VH249_21055 [Xanthobacteraceae bacterium]|jgi:hypothetical protein|nr:hypothetical protein [Xanthobacteraceae bacterium]